MGSVQENNCTNTELPGCEFVICVEQLGDVDIFWVEEKKFSMDAISPHSVKCR